MAAPLTPPTIPEYEQFTNEETADSDAGWITFMLQASTDAFWAFTGWTTYPTDERMARITRYAIMDLASWLLSQNEHRDEINSPFNSERIGSYSYSKMQRAAQSQDSGIYWLDMLFRLLANQGADGLGNSWVSAENIFNPEWITYEERERLEKIESLMPDPSEPWGF